MAVETFLMKDLVILSRRVTPSLIGVGALAFGLTACGGSGGSSSASVATSPTQATTVNPAEASAGLTPPGTKLAFGQKAIVGWVPPGGSEGPGEHKGYKLQITVESIQKGTIADFKNVKLKAEEQHSTPYYVKVRMKALGKTAPKAPETTDPDVTFDAIDDRGQDQNNIIFLGTFARCDDKEPPKPFVNGRSYESCLAYLMPGGGSIQKVQWNSGPAKGDDVTPYFEHPIVWPGN